MGILWDRSKGMHRAVVEGTPPDGYEEINILSNKL